MDNRLGFLQFLLGDPKEVSGWVRTATRDVRNGTWREEFQRYPGDLIDFVTGLDRAKLRNDIYFCPTLYDEPGNSSKEHISQGQVLWADLDTCPPENLLVPPTIVVRTSPGRWQAYWRLTGIEPAAAIEEINKRIAYYHAEAGCDRSGWDLSQMLRMVGTNNHKYVPDLYDIKVEDAHADRIYTLDEFRTVYPALDDSKYEDIEMPTTFEENDPDVLLDKVRSHVNPRAIEMFETVPKKDWSKALWQMQLFFFTAGLTRDEVFILAKHAKCNKYARDNRPDSMLWKEVCRAEQAAARPAHAPVNVELKEEYVVHNIQLLTPEEKLWCEQNSTIVEEYIEWAKTIGDAAWQYHQAGAFMILSTLLSGTVKLPTSYGTIVPNLWFMILADTTLTRKTTAMDMAMEMLLEIDPDCVLATDGSIEGLMTSLSTRPGRPSIFLRDEFSGLLDALTRKDYYAGMLETLTKLYDGKFQKRVLRKETLEVRDPVLILFAGGIKEKILSLLSDEHINSGFLPRFCFITAESDTTRLRPIGPPTLRSMGDRDKLIERFTRIWRHYNRDIEPGQVIPNSWDAELTDGAWFRYNTFETTMLDAGLASNYSSLLTPTFDRLCKSGLKMAVLLAALRCEDKVVVTERDLIRAFFYIEQLKEHTLTVIANVGKTNDERLMDRVLAAIKRKGSVDRSSLMRNHRLTARQADGIFNTLIQRGQIREIRGTAGGTIYEVPSRREAS